MAGEGDPRGWIRVVQVKQTMFLCLVFPDRPGCRRSLACNKVPMALAASLNSPSRAPPKPSHLAGLVFLDWNVENRLSSATDA